MKRIFSAPSGGGLISGGARSVAWKLVYEARNRMRAGISVNLISISGKHAASYSGKRF